MAPKPKKPHLTHFLLLPLATPASRPQLQSSLRRFAADLTAPGHTDESGDVPPTLPAKAIRPVGAIHFTIGVMSLTTPEQVDAACGFLKGLDVNAMLETAAAAAATETELSPSLKSTAPPTLSPSPSPPPQPTPTPPPIHLTLTGLSSLRPPTHTSALHASPSPSSSSSTSPHLHPFALALRAAFLSAGFLLPDPRPLTLHATLVNTIYARGTRRGKEEEEEEEEEGEGAHDGNEKKKKNRKRGKQVATKFDARLWIKRYQHATWMADVRLDKVSICEMGARDVLPPEEGGNGDVADKVYKEVASVSLPGCC